MGKLTVRRCETAPPGKHGDGGGLWLVVAPTGARKWVLRVTIAGKRREMGLGALPDVGLKAAREKATLARLQAAQGVDPIRARQQVKARTPTFTEAAAALIRAKRREWRNSKHARQWAATLKRYVRPSIGHLPVDSVSTEDVLAILKPVWHTRTETAKRVQGRVERVLDFASARGWRDASNPARWRGHLDALLASPRKVKRAANNGAARHHPAMPYTDVACFMRELAERDSISALALRWLILTATRTSETLQATWQEIGAEAAVWAIPAHRTKNKREHRIPLSAPALAVLEHLPRVTGCPYLFPGARSGRPLSNMALLQLMRGMGYGVNGERGSYVPHGFRSTFRDWAGDESSAPNHVCEMALGHTVGDQTEAAYRRSDLFNKRRQLMDAWADWCTPTYSASEAMTAQDGGIVE